MSTPGNPFAAIAAGQDGQSQSAPSPSANGNPFSAIASTLQPSGPQQPTGISRLWTPDAPDGSPNPDNLGQIKDAAIGAGKSIVKGLGNIGDLATAGLTHLMPGSDAASAGIGATGTALAPTNENQKYGGVVGDTATFELGNQIFSSLSKLPLAARLVQSAKALEIAQKHPVLRRAGAAWKSSGPRRLSERRRALAAVPGDELSRIPRHLPTGCGQCRHARRAQHVEAYGDGT